MEPQTNYDQNKMNKRNYNGYIRLYLGPMFSNKTGTLIEVFTRHNIGKRRCLLIKHSSDTRYDVSNVVAHNGMKICSSVSCDMLCHADHLVDDYDVVCIDEIQFFEDAPIFCDKWANQGLIIEAVGLNGTYQREEFPVISKLIPIAEEIHKKSAICRETGEDAYFTRRISDELGDIVIGSDDKYKPVDRYTFFNEVGEDKKNEYKLKEFKKFVGIYCKKHKLTNVENKPELVEIFKQSDKNNNNCYLHILRNYLNNK